MESSPYLLPRFGGLLRHAAPRIVEGVIAPVAVFLLGLHFLGVIGAIVAGLGFSYGIVGWRLLTGRRVPGLLVLGAVSLTARSVLAVVSGSVFVYFLQPTLGTALVAAAFLFSIGAGRPLAGRLARDFCPIPDEVATTAAMRRFFKQITLLWAVTEFVNAAVALWLLLSQSVGVFVVTRTVSSLTLSAAAVTLSVLWFRRSMSDHVTFAPRRVDA
ncbi:MAG TPA: VC0807 family protein [Acidimicrobiia bacterium]|nr:VC0807 family protein [Acidimicrobiia bacterium]